MFRIVRTMVIISVAVVAMSVQSAQSYVVSGRISTFGPPGESVGITADGGTDARPCIAIRDDWSLDDYFLVHIPAQERTSWHAYHAVLIHCDWGPAEFTGRSIDISGYGAYKLRIFGGFPTEAWGSATLIVKSNGHRRRKNFHTPLRR